MRRREHQRTKLLADGQEAIRLMDKGMKMESIFFLLGTSRARGYRAINLAMAPDITTRINARRADAGMKRDPHKEKATAVTEYLSVDPLLL